MVYLVRGRFSMDQTYEVLILMAVNLMILRPNEYWIKCLFGSNAYWIERFGLVTSVWRIKEDAAGRTTGRTRWSGFESMRQQWIPRETGPAERQSWRNAEELGSQGVAVM